MTQGANATSTPQVSLAGFFRCVPQNLNNTNAVINTRGNSDGLNATLTAAVQQLLGQQSAQHQQRAESHDVSTVSREFDSAGTRVREELGRTRDAEVLRGLCLADSSLWAQVRAARRLLGKLDEQRIRHAAAAATVDEHFRHAKHGRYAHGNGEMNFSYVQIFSCRQIGSV